MKVDLLHGLVATNLLKAFRKDDASVRVAWRDQVKGQDRGEDKGSGEEMYCPRHEVFGARE